MYFFDNEYLKDYIGLKSDLEIYIHGQWYDVPTAADVEDSSYGTAYDFSGKPITFDYRAITAIKALGNEMTLDMLQDVIAGKENSDSDTSGDDIPDPDMDTDAPDDKPEISMGDKQDDDKSKKESFNIGKFSIDERTAYSKELNGTLIRNIDKSCPHYNTRGVICAYYPSKNIIDYRIYEIADNSRFGATVSKRLSDVEIYEYK